MTGRLDRYGERLEDDDDYPERSSSSHDYDLSAGVQVDHMDHLVVDTVTSNSPPEFEVMVTGEVTDPARAVQLAEECRRILREAKAQRQPGQCTVCGGITRPGFGDHPSCKAAS